MDDKQNKAPWYKQRMIPKNVIWISGLIIGKKQGWKGLLLIAAES